MKTVEETLDYIRCMTLTQNVDPNVYKFITEDVMEEINKYIEDPMTATWFAKEDNVKPNREVITSEILYYYMIALNIPFECQKWHLNRLITLIRVCSAKNQPDKKLSKKQALKNQAALNAARRKALNSKG